MKQNDIVEILKPHPWHGKRAIITEGAFGEDKHFGVIVRDKRCDNTVHLSIPQKWLRLIESA